MSDTPSDPPRDTRAPADARPLAPWPPARKAIAYAILGAVALLSIWFIDLKVHRPMMADYRAPNEHR